MDKPQKQPKPECGCGKGVTCATCRQDADQQDAEYNDYIDQTALYNAAATASF